ncbi:TonB-dependent receptor [Rhodanobacter sp. Col0626]|uniref:TonB-dependent receptor n=1 Tax=Rhodanobacter sp. Col0626 TaxID=3415679 RepID=UPI003CEB01AE
MHSFTRRGWRRTTLAMGWSLACCAGTSFAQSSSGAVFGQVDAKPGTTVVLRNLGTGLTREVPVDSAGRYRAPAMPVGTYEVSLRGGGETLQHRDNVVVHAGTGAEVSFAAAKPSAADARTLEGISVAASALPAIDVSSVDTRTVLTSEQMARIPVTRDVTQAALLAPGAVGSDSRYGNTASFGGSAASENAYYINGYPVTNPLNSIGATTLPFDAIDQEQVLTGGYGPEFGRSIGGVINITTKRGGNTWKAGAAMYWSPRSLESSPRNIYYVPGTQAPLSGQLYQYRRSNKTSSAEVGAYISGPLIKDKLFFYASGEFEKKNSPVYQNADDAISTGRIDSDYKTPRWMTKLDWNLNDSNILEFTAVSDETGQDDVYYSPVDYPSVTGGRDRIGGYRYKDSSKLYVAKYTGYLTDNLTLSAQYGRQNSENYSEPLGYDPSQPYVEDDRGVAAGERKYSNPAQPYLSPGTPDNGSRTNGWRLDLDWTLGSHTLTFGVDRQNLEATVIDKNSGPGNLAYTYHRTQTPDQSIDAGAGIGAPGQQDYVDEGVFLAGGTFTVEQEAQYIQDAWQINDQWLLKLGLRNEQFTNYNGANQAYVAQRHQLAPRLGVSWDVFGDSSLKVFANAGRYHLALPNNVARRGIGGSLNTREYFTYTGVDANGVPTGLVPIGRDGPGKGPLPGPYSVNQEYGQYPDPRTIAAKNLKSNYQDEYILGMEKSLGKYVFGAKATYRNLLGSIDDTCYAPLDGFCRLFNPGRANVFLVPNDDGTLKTITVTQAESGFPELKRRYYALDFFLEHPLDNGWYGKVTYTFSRSYGDTEGQLRSDTGQTDVSQTVSWDRPENMVGSNGPLPNDRTHALKAYGYFEFTPEWRVGGAFTVLSGRPKNCNGYWPVAGVPFLGGGGYFFCGVDAVVDANGNVVTPATYKETPRGSQGRMPWEYTVDVNAAYRPAFADHQFELKVDVFNLFNSQVAQNRIERFYSPRNTLSRDGGRVVSYTDPRTVRLSLRYDFSL